MLARWLFALAVSGISMLVAIVLSRFEDDELSKS
jgi:hypothetical protein